jgi:ferredoxin-NADP reductase
MIQTFEASLTNKKQFTTDVWQFSFSLPKNTLISFVPGQYVLLKVPKPFVDEFRKTWPAERPLRGVSGEGVGIRQYSIASPSLITNAIDLLIQLVPGGLASSYLGDLKIGDTCLFQGPAGVFTLQKTPKPKIFVATGTGIAPLRSMLTTTFFDKLPTQSPLYLFWGLRKSSDVYYLEEFRSLAETYKNFAFRICLSKEENAVSLDAQCFGFGRVDKHLANFLDPRDKYFLSDKQTLQTFHNQFEYYVCGGDKIVESLRNLIMNLGVDKKNIFFEKFV